MAQIQQKVPLKWNGHIRKYYESKGYIFTKNGDEFIVDINDIPRDSHIKIKYICEYCEKEFDKMAYKLFNVIDKDTNIECEKKLCCINCVAEKRKEISLAKHGVKCHLQLKEIREKIKQTCLEKYGVESSNQSEEIKEKMKETNLERYGYEYTGQIPEVREKMKQTCLEKYGTEYAMQSEEIQKKMTQTCLEKYGVEYFIESKEMKQINLEKYGVEYASQSEKIQEKTKQTNLERYGVEYVTQNEEIKAKIEQTNLERYGVKHATENEEIQAKVRQSLYQNGTTVCPRQQTFIHSIIGGKVNYPIGNCSLDIAFPSEKVYIEYDGSGHDLNVKLGRITQEEFNKKEIYRTYHLKKEGWKLVRIISNKDYLFKKDDFIHILNKCKEYLLTNGRSWIIIDIDKKLIYNNHLSIELNYETFKLK